MINWERLYEVNGNNNKRAGTAFEKLAFSYLQQYYPQYHWDPTQSSWDNNHDFISIIYDYIWGEAKYKKDLTPLKRQDIDPTFISGLIDGKVRLVVFLTNSTIPHNIVHRVNQFCTRYDIVTLFITKNQLEYWLYQNPQIYKSYFNEELSDFTPKENTISIEYVSFSDQRNDDLTMPFNTPELQSGQFYLMNIVVQSVSEQIISVEPFLTSTLTLLQSPNYDDFQKCHLTPGLQSIKFLIKINNADASSEVLTLRSINGEFFSYPIPLKIFDRYTPSLSYAEQQRILFEIHRHIYNLKSSSKSDIFAIVGEEGVGKTYILERLMQDFFSTRVITKITFCEYADINYALLCKILVFLNFGAAANLINESSNDNDMSVLCEQMNRANNQMLFRFDWIEQLVAGCRNAQEAKLFWAECNSNSAGVPLIHPHRNVASIVLFCDDIQYLDDKQAQILLDIIKDCNKYTNAIIVLSSTNLQGQFYQLCDMSWALYGLSQEDVLDSIIYNLSLKKRTVSKRIVQQLPNKPILLCDIICALHKDYSNRDPFDILQEYIMLSEENQLFGFKFQRIAEYFPLLDIIYIFPKGIFLNSLERVGFDRTAIEWAIKSEYCQSGSGRIAARQALYRNAYLHYRGPALYNPETENILWNLLLMPHTHSFDYDSIYIALMQCSSRLQVKYKDKLQMRFMELYNSGNYKQAVFYANAYYDYILMDDPCLSEDAWCTLFYCGVCMMHCDTKRRGKKVFDFIVSKSPSHCLARYMAQAEQINTDFWSFHAENAYVDAKSIDRQLDILVDNKIDNPDLEIAISTCQNRLMAMYLLQDEVHMATKLMHDFETAYSERLSVLSNATRYHSMLGEWYMDYARGICVFDAAEAISRYCAAESIINISINPRRSHICEIDKSVLSILSNQPNAHVLKRSLFKNENWLYENDFYSEFFKSVLKRSFCDIYEEYSSYESRKQLIVFTERIRNEVYEAIVKADILIGTRETFLVHSLFGLLSYLEGDIDDAESHLIQILPIIKECGTSYRTILEHNLSILRNTSNETEASLQVFFTDKEMDVEAYWIDPRIW